MSVIDNNDVVFDDKVDLTEVDYDYLLMFIHLSYVPNIFMIGDLVNGAVEVTHLINGQKGYIYRKSDRYHYLYFNGETKLI